MRLKLLLVSMLMAGGLLYGQDTIKSLVITEARISDPRFNYVELTNMGDADLDMHDFEFGTIGAWTDHYHPNSNNWFMIGDYIDSYVPTATDKLILSPGESIWISTAQDYTQEQHDKDPIENDAPATLIEQLGADIVLHLNEAPSGPSDSISDKVGTFVTWNGRDCWYVRHHLANGDSAVIDQVGGVWDGNAGNNGLGRNKNQAYDVAGFTKATGNANLVRKFTVKTGNLDFAEGRGLTLDDSEWMPIPFPRNWTAWTQGRKMMWTVGNHGNYNLTEEMLVSSTLDVDFANEVINVPWGVHTKDSVMMQFDYQEGLAWNYQLNKDVYGGDNWEQAYMDTSYMSARTGDTLTIWACGEDLDEIKFHINLLPPTADANVIIPKAGKDDEGWYGDWAGPTFEVTNGVPGMDSILNVPFATRIDTIFKYFEKAPNANWEIIFVDGVVRPDVKYGDILKVTAEDGSSVKEYFVDVLPYIPSHNAYLSSIRWPDIPAYYKDVYGYVGDTVPNFAPASLNYQAIVPSDVEGVPALVAKPQDLNSKIEIERAVSLAGSIAERTVTITSSAEDDTTILVYKVELVPEVKTEDVQPWNAEPFVSEFVFRDDFSNNYLEICNPGTETMDLSNYMVVFAGTNDPVEIITWYTATEDWLDRYAKYIPGYKWVGEADWAVAPGTVEQDLNVDPIVQPGDVFVLGGTYKSSLQEKYASDQGLAQWWLYDQIDVDFKKNEWGEEIGNSIGNAWFSNSWFLFKILNDSITDGLKAADDPQDFELVEAWAMAEGDWVVGGHKTGQVERYIRKPQYVIANPEIAGSFGTTENLESSVTDGTSEWIMHDENWSKLEKYGWPLTRVFVTNGLGTHHYEPTTVYRSTVVSKFYEVSTGYGMEETIDGLKDGITVGDFLAEIITFHDDEVIAVYNAAGDSLSHDVVISDGDLLKATSADATNNTQYTLGVTAEGLSDDAVLTSSTLTVDVTGETGTVSGFEFGSTIQEVIEAVVVPAGASMDIIDSEGAYVSLMGLTYDTLAVPNLAGSDIYLEVTAANFRVKVVYQLVPNVEATDAFVVSNVYEVDSETFIIGGIPEGTAVAGFLKNVTPSQGAAMQVKDKAGLNRDQGNIYMDDRLTVTASDGETQNTYFFQMLEADIVYFAFVVSNVYVVDQNALTIVSVPAEDLNEKTLVSDFIANLKPADGATVEVLDADLLVKESGDDMDVGDIVRVTAGDGVLVTYYDVTVDPTGVETAVASGINVYPNPSTGIINVKGLDSGSRIQIFNSLGSLVLDYTAVSTDEVITLEDQGFYFMTISSERGVVDYHKIIIQ